MKRSDWPLFLFCASLVLAACKRDKPQGESVALETPAEAAISEDVSPPPEPPTIWFQPMDGATGVGEVVAEIRLEGGERIDSDLLQAVERSVRLETEVGIPVRLNTVASKAAEDDSRAAIALLPEEPLAAGSYVLRLPQLPKGVAEPRFPSHARLPDGSIGARFRVDSAPVLWGVRVCQKEAGTQVIVEFSERIRAADGVDRAVTIVGDGGDIGCRALPHGNSDSVGSLAFSCSKMDPAEELEVTVGAGLRGVAGARLAGSSHRFAPNDLGAWGSGCKLYRTRL